MSPFIIFYLKRKKKELLKEQKRILNIQFKDGIMALSAALQAGYSIENGFKEALGDLQMLYGKDACIVKEFSAIVYKTSINLTAEQILDNLAERSGVEDVKNFSEVFRAAKRSGGRLPEIIKSTAEIISEKIEIKREIETVITGKSYEQKIMSKFPFFIILYIDITSPGFFKILYGNTAGVIIMTLCLGVYMFSCGIAEKIVDIEV